MEKKKYDFKLEDANAIKGVTIQVWNIKTVEENKLVFQVKKVLDLTDRTWSYSLYACSYKSGLDTPIYIGSNGYIAHQIERIVEDMTGEILPLSKEQSLPTKTWFDNELTKLEKDPEFISLGLGFDFINEIIGVMKTKNISKQELAKKSKLSLSTIERILDWENKLNLAHIGKISVALGITWNNHMRVRDLDKEKE
jgi:hypothetical protein